MAFFEIFRAGGPVMFPLLLISLAAVAFAVERFLAFKQFGEIPPLLGRQVLDLVRQGQPEAAQKTAEDAPGPVGACLAAVLRRRDMPAEDIEREVATTGEEYFQRLERFLPALDTFTTLSPLLGLLGTILGMVKVFQQFTAASNDEGAKAQILAGVGESLYATAFGIAIAVFCFAVYNYFASKQRAISLETQQSATRLLAYLHEKDLGSGKTLAPESMIQHRRRRAGFDRGRALKKTKVEIIPMIDTMFFLLVFFILSSVGIIKLQGQVVNLPKAANGASQKPAELTVSINAQEQIKVNNTDIKKGQDIGSVLRSEAVRQVGNSPTALDNVTVVLSADSAVSNGLVVTCIDQARAVGISRFSIATDPNRSTNAGDVVPAP